MEKKKYPESANAAACEIIYMLYDSTRDLVQMNEKDINIHEQIRKNGETLLSLYVNVWN